MLIPKIETNTTQLSPEMSLKQYKLTVNFHTFLLTSNY